MLRLSHLLLIFLLFAASCSSNKTSDTGTTTSTTDSAQQNAAPIKPWYKRYTGTIAGQDVVVNLARTGNKTYTGSYSYNKTGILLDLDADNDSCNGNHLFLYETARTERTDENDYHNNAHWSATITDDQITGNWVDRGGIKSYPITLKEDYSGGAYRFQPVDLKDSLVIKHGAVTVTAQTEYLWPGNSPQTGKDGQFIEQTLIQKIGGSKTTAGSVQELVAGFNKKYFEDYRSTIDSTGDITADDVYMNSYESSEKIWVVYNQGGLIVFRFDGYEYTGGAHGMYGSTWACVDMQQKKIWELTDILKIDSPRLLKLIDAEVRNEFKIPADSALSTAILADTVNITDNIFFTHTGIVFNYMPYEIASFADGEVSLFIPFSKLTEMLTPEFKKRMNL